MEDRKLPWWRRALNVALDGIRSGFGLFSKPHKEDLDHAPEIAAAQDAAETAEARANLHSTVVGPVEEDAIAEAPAQVEEAVVEPAVELVAEPAVEAAEEESITEVVAETVDDPTERLAEKEGANLTFGQPERIPELPEAIEDLKTGDEPEAAVTSNLDEAAEGVVVPAPPPFSEILEAALVSAPEVEAQEDSAQNAELQEPDREVEDGPEKESEIKIEEEAIDEVVIEEPGVESAPIEHEEEIAIEEEAPEEALAELEVATAPEAVAYRTAVSASEVAEPEESELQTVGEPEPAIEASVEVVAEHSLEVEASAEAVAKDEPVREVYPATPVEPAEEIAEPVAELEAKVESPAEAAGKEEPAPAEDSIPKEPVWSVELSEPFLAEVAEEIPGQTESIGIKSQLEERRPAAEPVPQDEELEDQAADHDAEQVAEESPEPADIPMKLNEAIPEQPGPEQPAVSSEAEEAVAAADAAAEPIAVVETAESVDAETTEAVEATENVEPTAQNTAAAMIAAEAAAEVADEAGPTAAATPAPPAKPFIKLESRDNESDLSPFSVVVSQVYDGPLDLLLDLIRKQDIDIYDIPIARITAQFLAYVNQLKATDVDVAGEFIYIASLLIHIKSKMLLPRAPSGADDAAEDPRRELVERLLEHERFKNAAQMLQQKQMLEAATWTNPGLREFKDDTSAEPEIAADTVDLVRIFRDILERARNRPVINVEEDSVTVGQMIQFLARRLTMEDKPVALRRLLSQTRSERALIAMFLALLELVRLQAILLRQDKLFSEIFIKKHVGFETVMNEGAASARDDWR